MNQFELENLGQAVILGECELGTELDVLVSSNGGITNQRGAQKYLYDVSPLRAIIVAKPITGRNGNVILAFITPCEKFWQGHSSVHNAFAAEHLIREGYTVYDQNVACDRYVWFYNKFEVYLAPSRIQKHTRKKLSETQYILAQDVRAGDTICFHATQSVSHITVEDVEEDEVNGKSAICFVGTTQRPIKINGENLIATEEKCTMQRDAIVLLVDRGEAQ